MINAEAARDTFLQDLRTRTSPFHKALESLPISQALLSEDITREQYILYLRTMAPIIHEVEQDLFPTLGELLPDIEERRKSHLIEYDLAFLNAAPGLTRTPLRDGGYNLTPALALGIMYVIEGSTLGGRVIVKSISKSLGFNEEEGASYFAGYGPATGKLWKSFLDVLVTYGEVNDASEEIISGAHLAFKTIYNFFKDNTATN